MENVFVVAVIGDVKWQRILPLHFGGQGIYYIYETEGGGGGFRNPKGEISETFQTEKEKRICCVSQKSQTMWQ